jgi:hypothetical protein
MHKISILFVWYDVSTSTSIKLTLGRLLVASTFGIYKESTLLKRIENHDDITVSHWILLTCIL